MTKDDLKIEVLTPEIIQVPDYQYWASQNTLDAQLALRNLVFSWKFKPWQFTFNSTWNKSITWIWFKPKLVMFMVNLSTRSWCGQMSDDWIQNAISFADWPWTTECIYIRDSWWNLAWRATYVSMDTDWFTINVVTANWSTIYVNYTCFS